MNNFLRPSIDKMNAINQNAYTQFLNIGRDFFDGIDRPLRKRHEINNFLAFGFRKDDVILEALIDRWTDAEEVPLSRLNYWAKNKLLPYLNHWGSFFERAEKDQIVHIFSSGVEEMIRMLHQDLPKDPTDIEYTSIWEIKVAIALFVGSYIVHQKNAPISAAEARKDLNLWKDKVDSLIKKRFDDLIIPNRPELSPLKTLFDEIKLLVQTNG